MAAAVGSIHGTPVQQQMTSILIDEKTGSQIYGITLNYQTKYEGCDKDCCRDLQGIIVKGTAENLARFGDVAKVVQAASKFYVTLRGLKHTYSKVGDEDRIPNRENAYETCLSAYEKASKETGLTAFSEPSIRLKDDDSALLSKITVLYVPN